MTQQAHRPLEHKVLPTLNNKAEAYTRPVFPSPLDIQLSLYIQSVITQWAESA